MENQLPKTYYDSDGKKWEWDKSGKDDYENEAMICYFNDEK